MLTLTTVCLCSWRSREKRDSGWGRLRKEDGTARRCTSTRAPGLTPPAKASRTALFLEPL